MFARFLVYGCVGWVLETLFTGVSSVLESDRSATARTYLWMHPIYGAAGLLLERVHDAVRALPWPVRGAAYLGVIYAAELSSGAALRRVLGACPWDYGGRGLSVKGLIRLDYAPAWYVAGLAFEPVRAWVGQALTEGARPDARASDERQASVGPLPHPPSGLP